MNEKEALAWLEEIRAKKGICLGLERMKALLGALGSPQDHYKVIRVAGTNGKGSVTAAISSILHAAGIRAGRYTSPAVFSVYEQYVVDEKEINQSLYAEGMTAVREAAKKLGEEEPTAFEIETAFAFWLFAREGCEAAVFETGLGGDLDATNAAGETALSVITSIGLDHVKVLGPRLKDIAGHKAGIIRAGVPVICAEQKEEAAEVIRRRCEELAAPLTVVRKDDIRVVYANRQGLIIYYRDLEQLKIRQRGLFFAESAAIAAEAARTLGDGRITEKAVREGLLAFRWPGRYELIAAKPDTLLDGAHNPDGIQRLKESLRRDYGNSRISFVMGVLADKDYRQMVSLLLGMAARVYTVTPDSSRALAAEDLARAVRERFPLLSVSCEESVEEAVRKARAAGDPVVVCGTLTIAAAAKRAAEACAEEC